MKKFLPLLLFPIAIILPALFNYCIAQQGPHEFRYSETGILSTQSYCNPASGQTNPCDNGWINHVTLGNTVNRTSGCAGGYSDYTATDTLKTPAGKTISFLVSNGSTTGWDQYVFIFIDFNHDDDFDDAGEKVVDGIYMNTFGTDATGTFTLPPFMPDGNYRLRVISDAYETLTSPCYTELGEAEDYAMEVKAPAYCTPVVDQPCTMWINNTTIGNISNSTSQPVQCTPGGYADFYNVHTVIAGPGDLVDFSLSATGTNTTNQLADVYIDFNTDGDFSDPGEIAASGILLGYSGQAVNWSFSIPPAQPYGYYRIRVRSYSVNESQPGPCGNSNYGDIEDYRLLVTCVPNGSDISVSGNGQLITSGDITPDITDHTDFGNVVTNTSFTRTFTIDNNGTGILNITGLTLSGPDAANFTVLTQPAAAVPAGGSTAFTIQFTPVFLTAYNAVIHITSNNCSKADYFFSVRGTGACSPTGPEFSLFGNGVNIERFDFLPSVTDSTDYGNVVANTSMTHTFWIRNTGTLPLAIYDTVELVNYEGQFQYKVTTQPANTVAPGDSTSFSITFTPVGSGYRYSFVRIYSNDCDEPFFDYLVAGNAVCQQEVPEISVSGNGTFIADGAFATSLNDFTDFGVVPLNTAFTRTYAIGNTGTDPLHISGVDITGSGASSFSVISMPSPVIAPGGTSSLTIQFLAATAGEKNAVVRISNDDCDEGVFDFRIRGTDGTHCLPLVTSPCSNSWISNFTMGNINNSSGCINGYTDNSASLSTTVQPGATVGFSITNGGGQAMNANIYADLNQDGDFDDFGEQLTNTIFVGEGLTEPGIFSIPALQPFGIYRLRVVCDYYVFAFTTPCTSNNGEIEDYTLVVGNCVPNGSAIVVKGNAVLISAGDLVPDLADHTDFGNIISNTTFTRTYTIENTGTNTLTLDAINITGPDAAYFTVVTPPSMTITAGSSTGFTVQYAPLVSGNHDAVIHVLHTDCTAMDYDFAVKGTASGMVTLNLDLFLEGFYDGSNAMRPLLYDLGISTDPSETDTIRVNLWAPTSLSNPGPDYSEDVIVHTNGNATVQLPAVTGGNDYYIAVKHRNHLETWSHNPVTFSATTNYGFTTGMGQAYDDGVNPPMVAVAGGKFAFYGGDVNQDGTVDASDMSDVDNDNGAFAFGYNVSDATGDGATDASDIAVVDNNQQLFLFYARPY